MAIITGSITQGESVTYGACLQCDGCDKRAPRQEAPTLGEATRLALKVAEEEGFVAHGRGRKWLCPACRLRSLPDHIQQLFPRLLAQHAIELHALEDAGPPRPRRARRRKD
jgi:hypothetical protein